MNHLTESNAQIEVLSRELKRLCHSTDSPFRKNKTILQSVIVGFASADVTDETGFIFRAFRLNLRLKSCSGLVPL